MGKEQKDLENKVDEVQTPATTAADAARRGIDLAGEKFSQTEGKLKTAFAPKSTFGSEADVLAHLERAAAANRELSEEDEQKMRRQRRSEGIVSGISDAVRSLSNLYFTTQYAPNMYDHSKGMSETSKARWEKIRKDREAESDRHFNYVQKGHEILTKRAATEYQQQQDRLKAEFEARKLAYQENRDAWQAQARQLELEIKQAQIAGNQKLANEKLEELKRHNQAIEHNGYLSATRPRGSGSGGGSGSGRGLKVVGTLPDDNGNEVPYYNVNDYKRDVEERHKKTGLSSKNTYETKSWDGTRTTEREKSIPQKAAEIKANSRTKKKKKFENIAKLNLKDK